MLSRFLVSPLAWIMKDIHLVYLSIQYLLLVRCIWGLFIITALQAQHFPLRYSSSLLMFDEYHNKELEGGVRGSTCATVIVFSTPTPPSSSIDVYSIFSNITLPPQGHPAFPGLPFSSPQGKFGQDWIRQEKVGHWLWSLCCIVSVKVKSDTGIFPPTTFPQLARRFFSFASLSSCLFPPPPHFAM